MASRCGRYEAIKDNAVEMTTNDIGYDLMPQTAIEEIRVTPYDGYSSGFAARCSLS